MLENFDIAVIGGGIAGVSVAARLSKHAKIGLWEQEDSLAYHSSSRSAAVFISDYGNSHVCELNLITLHELQSKYPDILQGRGLLSLEKDGEIEEFKSHTKSLGLSPISVDEAKEKAPIIDIKSVKQAAWRDDVFDIDTDLLIQTLRKECLGNGVQIFTNAAINSLERNNDKWILNSKIRAEIIINASGAWADDIARLGNLKPKNIQPFKRSMAKVEIDTGHNLSFLPLLVGSDDTWYAKPDAGSMIVSPADFSPCEPHDAWAHEEDVALGIYNFEKMIETKVKKLTSNWAGLRSFAPDQSLVIGPDAEANNFFWLAGQGGYGFQTCLAASQIAEDLLFNQISQVPNSISEKFSPDRFT
ncbi:MAG: NAD(P)/FAD-dependent oxidoreductase [Paracoccaceae bacterium]